MSTAARAFEVAMVAVIAVAVLVGGASLLVQLTRAPLVSGICLGVLMVLVLAALRRDLVAVGLGARVRASRDVAFVAAIVAAICFVLAPARWSNGATVTALEFGFVLELLMRLAPAGTPQIPKEKTRM